MGILHWISTLTARIMRAWAGRYRPERHYMRGAGPASKEAERASHGTRAPEGLIRSQVRVTPQDLPRVSRGLPTRPCRGWKVCRASLLWSSQIFCDSVTEVS